MPFIARSQCSSWLGVIFVALLSELSWFGLLYPFVPKTWSAGLTEAFLPLPILGYVFLVVKALTQVYKTRWHLAVRHPIMLLLIVSVGTVAFAAIVAAENLLRGQFG